MRGHWFRLFGVALLVAASLSSQTAVAAQQATWLVVPGQGIGSAKLGMSPEDLIRVWGRPASDSQSQTWTYEKPIRARVGFARGLVSQIDSWDLSISTSSGIRMGTSESEAIRRMGQPYQEVPAQRGRWLSYPGVGLAIFIERWQVAGFSVFPAQAPMGVQTPKPPSPTQAQQQAPSLKIRLIEVGAEVHDPQTIITGKALNISSSPVFEVAIGIEANGGGPEKRQQRKVVASKLDPNASSSFAFELTLVTEYRVYVESHSPKTPQDLLDEAKGSIKWTLYPSMVRRALFDAFRQSASASVGTESARNGVGSFRVEVFVHQPAYSFQGVRVTAVTVEVVVSMNPPQGAITQTITVRPGSSARFMVIQSHRGFPPRAVAHVVDVIYEVTD